MSHPTDFAAVESNDSSYLFYIQENGTIACLMSNSAQEGNNTAYSTQSVTASANAVHSESNKIAAVAYTMGDHREVRLYYIGKDDTEYKLCELCMTDEGEWLAGTLDQNNISVNKDSLLSANVGEDKGDVKVFFVDRHDKPAVAWVTLGQTSWASHRITADW